MGFKLVMERYCIQFEQIQTSFNDFSKSGSKTLVENNKITKSKLIT